MPGKEQENGAREVDQEEFTLSLQREPQERDVEETPQAPVRSPREVPTQDFETEADLQEEEAAGVDESFLQRISASLESGRQRGVEAMERGVSPVKWILLLAIAGILLTSLVTGAVMSVQEAWAIGAMWGVVASVFWGIAGLAVVFLAFREMFTYLALRKFEPLRELAESALSQEKMNPVERNEFYEEFEQLCVHLDDYAMGVDRDALSLVRRRMREEEPPDELCRLTSEKVLRQLDEQAYTVITGEAFVVAGIVSLSPFAVLDGVIVTLRGLRMIRRVAEIYRIRPGTLGTVRLLRKVFGTALYANFTQIALTAFSGRMTGKVFQKIGVATAQGLTTGALFLWVGLAVQREVRPIPFTERNHQAGMLRTLWHGLRRMLKRGEKEE